MFCIKCGAELPEGARFCIRCGNPLGKSPELENAEPKNTVLENPVLENAEPKNPMPENAGPKNTVQENAEPKTPMPENAEPKTPESENAEPEKIEPENAEPGNPVSENLEPKKSVVQEKTVAVKPVMNEIGKKLESAKPMIGKMGEKLESARPMIDKMGEKLESTKPVIGKIANKLKVKPGKKKVIIIGAVAVVLALIMLLKGGGSGAGSGLSSPEEAFDAWMTGFCLHDFDLTLQAEPDFVIEYEGGEARLKETLQKNYEDDIAIYPNAGTFKFEATGHTMLGKDEEKEVEQAMCDKYNVDIKISAAAVIDHRLVDLSDGSAGDILTSGYAFKYKRKWYYLNVQSL